MFKDVNLETILMNFLLHIVKYDTMHDGKSFGFKANL